MMQKFNTIDIFKIILSVLIVALHTSLCIDVSKPMYIIITQVLSRIAVPYFFILSGYFLFSKTERNASDQTKLMVTWFVRNMRLFFVWSVIYLPFTIVACMQDPAKAHVISYIKTIIWRTVMWGGDIGTHLWFLSALAMAGFIVWLVHYKFRVRPQLILGVTFALYIVGVMLSTYCNTNEYIAKISELYHSRMLSVNTLVFSALFWVCCGLVLAKKKKIKTTWWALPVAIIVNIVEICWCTYTGAGRDTIYSITLPLVALSAAAWSIDNVNKFTFMVPNEIFNPRALTLLVYCVHILIKKIWLYIVPNCNSVVLFLGVLIGSFITSVAILWGAKKVRLFRILYE